MRDHDDLHKRSAGVHVPGLSFPSLSVWLVSVWFGNYSELY